MPDRPRALTLSLVLPVLDEADNLRELLPPLLERVPHLHEIIIVDDGSTDGSGALVETMAKSDPRLRWLARNGAPSLTDSLREGFAAATGDLIGWMDADGTMPIADLHRLAEAVRDGAALAVGSRFVPGGGIKGELDGGRMAALLRVGRSRDPVLPVLLSWALNTVVVPVIVRDGVHDYTSGFAVGRREVVQGFELRGRHGEYFVSLFAQARRRGHEVVELPYRARPRTTGQSKSVGRWMDYVTRGRQYLGAAWAARDLA
ncbi:MAG: glycosyltransferase [Myxococcota bacterium]